MNEHKKTIYTTPEETKHIASEDAVAYAAPQAAPQHISNADALWTLIQSQDEDTHTKLCQMITSQYGKGEAYSSLIQRLSDFQEYEEGWDGDNALPLNKAVVRNLKETIKATPEELLEHWTIYPEPNGTILLQMKDCQGAINIGEKSLSYFMAKGTELQGQDNILFSVSTVIEIIKLAQNGLVQLTQQDNNIQNK